MAQFLRVRRRDYLFYLRTYTSKRFRKCYYEVLGVPKTASQKEIKEAFVKLSKELHPDLNKNKNSHNDFTALNEAYTVLSKTHTRSAYDFNQYRTSSQAAYNKSQYPYEDYRYYNTRMYTGPREHAYRDTHKDENARARDRRETANLVFLCIGIMIVGSILQGILIKYPLFFSRDALLKRSKRIEEEYQKLKAEREKRTNDETMTILINRYNADRKLREQYRETKAAEKKSFW